MKTVKFLFGCLICLCVASQAQALITITVGDVYLSPNMAGQTVPIYVTGTDSVQALNFNAQIADGGPEAGGSISGPHITSVDLVTGTIFASNNRGQTDLGSVPQLAMWTTATSSGYITGNGLLATLTVDTTGFNSGSWAFALGDTKNGATDFAGISATITDGSITIVPEPSTYLLTGSGILLLGLSRRCWNRR